MTMKFVMPLLMVNDDDDVLARVMNGLVMMTRLIVVGMVVEVVVMADEKDGDDGVNDDGSHDTYAYKMFDDDRDGVAIMMTEMKKVDFGTGGCE